MTSMLTQTSTSAKSLVETLQCPVCYGLPVPPIFGCQNGHIVCNNCKDHVHHCPVCRSEKFNVRNVVIEEILSSPVLECPNRHYGCNSPKMTGAQYTAHINNCDFRPIECHCKLGYEECHGKMISKAVFLDHMIEFHGASPPAKLPSLFVSCEMYGPFAPKYFSFLGTDFILLSYKDGIKFWTWVATTNDEYEMEPYEFYVKITLKYYFGRNQLTFSSEIIPPVSSRDTPNQVLKAGHCLEFSAATAPSSLPPYVWPGYVEEDEDERGLGWGYDVEISQAQIRRESNSYPSKTFTKLPPVNKLVRRDFPVVLEQDQILEDQPHNLYYHYDIENFATYAAITNLQAAVTGQQVEPLHQEVEPILGDLGNTTYAIHEVNDFNEESHLLEEERVSVVERGTVRDGETRSRSSSPATKRKAVSTAVNQGGNTQSFEDVNARVEINGLFNEINSSDSDLEE